MNIADAIHPKQRGRKLDSGQIRGIFQAYHHGEIADASMASLMKAIKQHHLDIDETVALTEVIADRGIFNKFYQLQNYLRPGRMILGEDTILRHQLLNLRPDH